MIKFDRQYSGITRWSIPFIANGAITPLGGHWRVLGIFCRWNHSTPIGWSNDSSLSLWGIVSIVHMDTEGKTLKSTGPEWKVNFLRLDVKAAIRPASSY